MSDMRNVLVIAFNGPPGSGKDYIADEIEARLSPEGAYVRSVDVTRQDMKEHLTHATTSFFNVGEHEWGVRYLDRELKEKPWHKLYNMSQREALIWMSETVAKPHFGRKFFAHMYNREVDHCLEIIKDFPGTELAVFLMADAGFFEEQEAVVEHVGRDNYFMVNVLADGYDFSNDSRDYVYPEQLRVDGMTFTNNREGNGDEERFEEQINTILERVQKALSRSEIKRYTDEKVVQQEGQDLPVPS